MEPSFSNLKPKKQVKNKTENRIRVECPNGTVPILKNTKKYVANAQYWAERHFNPLTDESPGKHVSLMNYLSYKWKSRDKVNVLLIILIYSLSVSTLSKNNFYTLCIFLIY